MKYYRYDQIGHVACMGEMKNAYKILVRKPERNIGCCLFNDASEVQTAG
jgi:hypothetical protein